MLIRHRVLSVSRGKSMSNQVIDEVDMEPQESFARVSSSPDNEFHYRPVSSLAVCSLVLGLLSLLGIFLWPMLPVALLGVISERRFG